MPQNDSARQENPHSRQRQARHGSVPRPGGRGRVVAFLEYEVVSAAPDGEQLADDYEELGGGRCTVM